MHGPIVDAVPSTNEFEMYAAGLTSIASYLSANHYNVRIINLAYLMLAKHDFDVGSGSVRGPPAPGAELGQLLAVRAAHHTYAARPSW